MPAVNTWHTAIKTYIYNFIAHFPTFKDSNTKRYAYEIFQFMEIFK